MSWVLVLSAGLPLLSAHLLYLFRRVPLLPFVVLPLIPSVVLVLSGRYITDISFYPGILLGLKLGMDEVAQVFLLFTTLLWGVSGVFAIYYLREDNRIRRFFFFHLLCMSGNIGVILSQDIPGFYMFFALMSIAAYGLVVHDGTPAAFRAGRVYITMAIIGEALIAVGLFLVADASGSTDIAGAGAAISVSEYRDIIVALILAGFGIKAGLLTLHMWLPLSYLAAPVPASALLSGSMINAGLLGWIRFLPLGEVSLQEWAWICISIGLIGAFFGVAVGIFQADRKIILAYSSISQMGIMTTGIGIGFFRADAWPLVMTAILIYAFHHALAKGALFLSTGLTGALHNHFLRIIIYIGMLLSALALAGAPLTSGVFAKTALKQTLYFLPAGAAPYIAFLLQAAAAATAVLMARFIDVMVRDARLNSERHARGVLIPWAVLIIFMVLLFSPYGFRYLSVEPGQLLELVYSYHGIKSAFAPLLAGALSYLVFIWLREKLFERFTIPPGDVLELFVRLAGPLKTLSGTISRNKSHVRETKLSGFRIHDKWLTKIDSIELKLTSGTSGFIFFLLVAAGLIILIGSI